MTTAVARVARSRTVPAPREAVWEQVADVDGLTRMMESVQAWERLAEDRYRWRLRTYSALGYHVTPEIDLKILWHPQHRVVFAPAGSSAEHARADGSLMLAEDGPATHVEIRAAIEVDLSIPRLLGTPATAVLSHEVRSGFDRFLARLATAATA